MPERPLGEGEPYPSLGSYQRRGSEPLTAIKDRDRAIRRLARRLIAVNGAGIRRRKLPLFSNNRKGSPR